MILSLLLALSRRLLRHDTASFRAPRRSILLRWLLMVQRLEFAKNDRVNGQHTRQLLIASFRVKLGLCPHTMLVMVLRMATPSVRFWPGRRQDCRSHRRRI